MSVIDLARIALLCVEAIIAFFVLYLLVVASAATLAQARARRHNAAGAPRDLPAFVIVIPAHDEESTLGNLLGCLSALTYPRERFTVCVVADNCEDGTAALARGYAGVRVYERHDARQGKGYALAWIFEQIAADGLNYDACLVLDADAVIGPGLLHAYVEALSRGAQAIQGRYLVLNPSASPSSALRWLALALANYVRPLGRYTLGASASITGNGFCLTRELLRDHPWRAFGLAEDYQYYLGLAQSGVRVHYAPDAHILSLMPTRFSELRTQDIRWESVDAGQTPSRVIAWRLLLGWARTGDFRRLEAVIELLTPQISVLALSSVLLVVAAAALRSPAALVLSLGVVAGLTLYVSSAFSLLHPPLQTYRAVLIAPWYAAQKAWILLVVRHRASETNAWVRTRRESESVVGK